MKGGYIAIDRGIFEHWIAKSARHLKAWQQMIAAAEYGEVDRKGSWGSVRLRRAEFVASEWRLAEEWEWSRSAVQRFLQRLERDGMIKRFTTRSRLGTKSQENSEQPTGHPTGHPLAHDITIITICNYDHFQKSSTPANPQVGTRPGTHPGTRMPQGAEIPGLLPPLTTEPLNHTKKANGTMDGEEKKRVVPTAPRHGARSKKHGTIFFLHDTEEWRIHAADYRETMGAEPLPNRWGGFWFYYLGEAARPGHQRSWRDPAAFGAAQTRRRA